MNYLDDSAWTFPFLSSFITEVICALAFGNLMTFPSSPDSNRYLKGKKKQSSISKVTWMGNGVCDQKQRRRTVDGQTMATMGLRR